MKRTTILSSLFVFAALAACSGSDDDGGEGSPTPTCTPPPAVDIDIILDVVNAEDYAGNPAAFRVELPDDMVLFCTTSMVPAGGDFEIFGSIFGPVGGAAAELILSDDADPAFATADFQEVLYLGLDGTLSGDSCDVERTWSLTVDATDPGSAVSWTPGIACPG